jgi:serine/threonine protein kinase
MKPAAKSPAANRNRMAVDPAPILCTILDPEHFESLDRYRPSLELRSLVEQICTQDWQITADGFWTRCVPPEYSFNIQGWKIHISATESSAMEMLQRIIPLLAQERVAFKFASDRRMVRLSTSKNWPRSGGGKFITIYPKDAEHFVRLLELCHQASKGVSGPYILSDRPYKDSRVVYYRYGGHKLMDMLDAHGVHIPVILSSDGQVVADERVAFYKTPDWVKDPFQETLGASPLARSPSANDQIKLKDRYVINGAIKYSNAGGIYTGTDLHTGRPVICREARPFIRFGGEDGTDAITLLQKEARILEKLNETGITPHFVDLFSQWEHWFLVEEHLQAESLWGIAMEAIFGHSSQDPAKLFRFYHNTIVKLTRGLQIVHEHQVVLRDFTKQNVLFTHDGQVKFIDFELAYELDRCDRPVAGCTEGYASPEQMSNRIPTVEQDYYALGALILDSLAFTSAGLPLNRGGVLAGLKQVLDDFALPSGLLNIVEGLTEPDPHSRWRPDDVLSALSHMEVRAGDNSPSSAGTDSCPEAGTAGYG